MSARSRSIARTTNAAVPTAGAAFARPRGASQVKIKVGSDAYVGRGATASPPAATATNSVYLDANEQEIWDLDARGGVDAYVYVYAVIGTASVKLSWYG